MAFTDPFIRRPVLASVISLLIVLLGIQAFNSLTIRQYPQMESALITVTTAYPGANAETIQGYITQPLQQSLASAEGVDYMTSVSQQNASVISVYARIGADTDRLYTELLSQANSVKNQLPQDAEDPVLNKQAADSTALMYISFYSDQLSNPQITDYLSRVIQPKLATLPGMAEAEILGNQVFAMRLWLDPVKLAAYGVSAGDVNEAVRKYNFLSAAGEVKGQYVVTSINADTELKTPEAFAAIPLKTQGDSRVLLGDVARVEMGAESYNSISSFDGIPSVYIGIKGTPSANPLDVIKEVRAIMPQIEAQLPPGLKATIAYDATEFIQASIDEVVKTLAEAAVIVIVVVFLFLGSLRTVLIPVVTIPLSMIGVLFFMQAMGYSINLLTLLAMVLAIGLVVDDAIVVVENIHRHIEQGKSPFQAALDGAREIAMPVVSMTITLAAVYAPIGFLQGLTGALFQEFALTLAGAVLISGVVALTLSPMMCSKLLRHEENPSGFAHRLDELFERLKQRYQRALHGTLNTRPVVLVFAVLVLALIPVLLMFTERTGARGGPGYRLHDGQRTEDRQPGLPERLHRPVPGDIQELPGVLLLVPDQRLRWRAERHWRLPAQTLGRARTLADGNPARGTGQARSPARPADLRFQPAFAARHRRRPAVPVRDQYRQRLRNAAAGDRAHPQARRGVRQVRLPRCGPGVRQARRSWSRSTARRPRRWASPWKTSA